MAKTGVDNIEDLRGLGLGMNGRAELIQTQSECTFVFTNEDGWASGVVMTYTSSSTGRFGSLPSKAAGTCVALRRIRASSMVVSNAGAGLPGRRMLSMRGTAIIHRDAATKERFLEAFAARHQPEDSESFIRLLNSANRVVIQFHPTAVAVSHDSTKMPGNGRGRSSVPA